MARVVLIISGGIAAWKALDLISRLRARGHRVTPVLTRAGAAFVTPLSVAAMAGENVREEMPSPEGGQAMEHIRLAREADVVVVAPATADIIGRLALGLAQELADTMLLAYRGPLVVAPAMNPAMWEHPALQAHVATLAARGVVIAGPCAGVMACGEEGTGRMMEPADLLGLIERHLPAGRDDQPLRRRRALVTGGPTREQIDPVRYISNRSSGRQAYAIAEELARAGAETILVCGPTSLPPPPGVIHDPVVSARDMLERCRSHMPVDILVAAAAVCDVRPRVVAEQKLKKPLNGSRLELVETPDVLWTLASDHARRPTLVVGFAAETENLLASAGHKRQAKCCDWMLANDVSQGVFDADDTRLVLISDGEPEEWPAGSKHAAAARLVSRIGAHFRSLSSDPAVDRA